MKSMRKKNKAKDLTGQKFNMLTVLSQTDDVVGKNGQHHRRWLCQCECGNTKKIRETSLRPNGTKSCGCLRIKRMGEAKLNDLTGKTFGKWIVLERAEDYISGSSKFTQWKCRCECGTIKTLRGNTLRSGETKSCGCLRKNNNKKQYNLIGEKFGRWVVINTAEPIGSTRKFKTWLCKCECGTIRAVAQQSLLSHKSLSCGCARKEQLNALQKVKNTNSSFEQWTTQYLVSINAEFEEQKTYPGMRRHNVGIAPSYDFCVYRMKQPDLLIECQGAQHYKAVNHYGGEKRYQQQKERDQFKRDYAHKRGLTFVEIDCRSISTKEEMYQELDKALNLTS